MSKKWPQKPKNCLLNHMHIQNGYTLEKYLKLFLKIWPKNGKIKVLGTFTINTFEKYLKLEKFKFYVLFLMMTLEKYLKMEKWKF